MLARPRKPMVSSYSFSFGLRGVLRSSRSPRQGCRRSRYCPLRAQDQLVGPGDALCSAPGSTEGAALGVISASNRLTMLWYFWMYQRFSLLYLGIATGRTSVPSAFQTHGQVTGVPTSCTGGRLSWSSLTLVRVRTR